MDPRIEGLDAPGKPLVVVGEGMEERVGRPAVPPQDAVLDVKRGEVHRADLIAHPLEKIPHFPDRVSDAELDNSVDDDDVVKIDPEGDFLFPGLDHVLDLLAGPAAIVAGTVATASFVGDVSPFLKWSLAIIAGGGAAGIVHSATSVTRVASSVTTAGIGNPFLSAAETGGPLVISVLSLIFPIIAVSIVVVFVGFVVKRATGSREERADLTERKKQGLL